LRVETRNKKFLKPNAIRGDRHLKIEATFFPLHLSYATPTQGNKSFLYISNLKMTILTPNRYIRIVGTSKLLNCWWQVIQYQVLGAGSVLLECVG
jgi:hypothetical protein